MSEAYHGEQAAPTPIRDASVPRGSALGIPAATAADKKSPGAITVSEALADLQRQQDMLKGAMDRMISDAMTLRAQM